MKEKEEVLGIDKTALTPEFNNKLRDLLACRGHGRIGEIDRTMAAKFIGA